MAIERLHFACGYPLDLGGKRSGTEQIQEIVNNYRDKAEILLEGDYDLATELWTEKKLIHKLTVLADGRGLYRAFPRFKDAQVTKIDLKVTAIQQSVGGSIIHLPQDKRSIIVADPLRNSTTLFGIYDIIFYTPEPSPKISFAA
jgi:hypothetical protein